MPIRSLSATFALSAFLAACGGGGGGDAAPAPAPAPAPVPSPISGPSASDALGILLLAGAPGGFGNSDGTGSEARFGGISAGVVLDGEGSLYLADPGSKLVRKVTPTGEVTTVAGTRSLRTAGTPAAVDGPAATARFAFPWGVARDSAGNLYVSDGTAIRKVDPAGNVSTLAGQLQTCGTESDALGGRRCANQVQDTASGYVDGPGTVARFRDAQGLGLDAAGNVYVADRGNYVIRKITPAGVVSTLAGSGVRAVGSAPNGTGAAAAFQDPRDVAVKADGTVYVADRDVIRQITPAGVVTTLAGTPEPGTASGDPRFQDGTGPAALFRGISSLAFDAAGNLVVSDTENQAIRKVTPQGVVTTLLRNVRADAEIDVDAAGNILFARGYTVHRVTPAGVDSLVAGRAAAPTESTDGVVDTARFAAPGPLAVDADGNTLVVEGMGGLRRVTADGRVSTLVGRSGPSIWDVAFDRSGDALLSTPDALYRMTPAGGMTLVAGGRTVISGCEPHKDGPALSACFWGIQGVVANAAGELFIADSNNHVIRKLGLDGNVTTIAGQVGVQGTTNGPRGVATLSYPTRMAIDAAGNLYLTEFATGWNGIRRITPAGEVSTFAGGAFPCDFADGARDAARFCGIRDIAFDHRGNLYIADGGNYLVRKLAADGAVSTVAGSLLSRGLRTGALPGSLPMPLGIATTRVSGDERPRLIVSTSENVVVRITAP